MQKEIPMLFELYKTLLKEFLKFKSISTDPTKVDDLISTSKWLSDLFAKNGFTVSILKGTTCNPVVVASYVTSNDAETVLVYGHYDVQPAEKDDGWFEDPFTLYETNNKFYGRGIVDNKGQVLIHIATVFELINKKQLKYNVKFVIEGNEETSNDDLAGLVAENKDKFACDYIVISDGEIIGNNPVIESSLRGGFNCTLKYITANNNLHSGIYGGAVPSAAHELQKLLSKIYDENNKITIEGFYNNVDQISVSQIANNKKLLPDVKTLYDITGVKTLLTETDTDYFTQIGLRPTLQVTGLKSGYIGEGYANIVPSTAEVKINFRIVMSQKYKDVMGTFEKFVKDNTPSYVTYELNFVHPHDPIKIDISSQKVQETIKLLETAFDKEVLIKPVGGAIPVVSDFKRILGIDSMLISLGNDDCNMHGVNENYNVDLIHKGLIFSKMFFSK